MIASSTNRHQSTNIREMIARLGIDLGDKRHGLLHATALRRCRACLSKKACRTWLDHSPADLDLPPRFCPSADILFELHFGQLRPHRQPR
jgi:hypothetical protein